MTFGISALRARKSKTRIPRFTTFCQNASRPLATARQSSILGTRRAVMDANTLGRSVRRLEDFRFLTGRGRYVDDVAVPGAACLHVLRSPHAHAVIEQIDIAAARAAPGVLGVFTDADLSAEGLGPLPCVAQVASVDPLIAPPRYALARGRVRHIGDPIAFVVAESRELAR